MPEETSNKTTPEEISKAVKEALDDRRMDDMNKNLVELRTEVKTGFAEVHLRQDTTNGKVLKNTGEIEKIKGNDRYQKLIWYLFTAAIVAITYLLTKHS